MSYFRARRTTQQFDFNSKAPRARSGELDVSKGSFIYVVPFDPAYKAGLAGHVPAKEIDQSEFL